MLDRCIISHHFPWHILHGQHSLLLWSVPSHKRRNSRLIQCARADLPQAPAPAGFRQIRDEDFPAATALLNDYLSRFKLRQAFEEHEVRHFLTPQEGLVYAYVVEAEDSTLTDLCSFYCLPSSILNHPQHSELRAAYMRAPAC